MRTRSRIRSRFAVRRYLFSAKNAAIISSLGERPRDVCSTRTPALKARFNFCLIEPRPRPLSRAFSADREFLTSSWGVAPGCDDTAPLALNTRMRSAGVCSTGGGQHR